jgi:hypothetical protein
MGEGGRDAAGGDEKSWMGNENIPERRQRFGIF